MIGEPTSAMTVTVIVVGVTPTSGEVRVAVLHTLGRGTARRRGRRRGRRPPGRDFLATTCGDDRSTTAIARTHQRSRISISPGSFAGRTVRILCRAVDLKRPRGPRGAHDMAVMIPSSRYVTQEFAQREHDLLWPRVWQLACSLDHVAQPGDFHEYRVGYAISTHRAGQRRRAAGLPERMPPPRQRALRRDGAGLTELRCPFHRWTWDLAGHLREVPSRARVRHRRTTTSRSSPSRSTPGARSSS